MVAVVVAAAIAAAAVVVVKVPCHDIDAKSEQKSTNNYTQTINTHFCQTS